MSDHFAALVETQLLRRRQGNAASMPARSLQLADAGTKAPPPAEVDRQEGETSDLLSGCLMLGPHGVVYSSGDGDGISETDTAAVRAVAEAALQLHPTGQPKSLYVRGLRYTVTRCERSHVLAVSRDEERGVIVSAVPHGVLVSFYSAPVKMVEVAAAVYRFAALLRA
eukprot:m.20566 g.20566  ORF g.20566 m.20566 type:complete len:168 (+) comp5587_c0_seq1:170-673(+)